MSKNNKGKSYGNDKKTGNPASRKNPSRRRRNHRDFVNDKNQTSESMNDVSDYTGYPALVATAASLAYGYPTGAELNLGLHDAISDHPAYTGSVQDTTDGLLTVPGVLTFHMCPSIGKVNGPTDPANLAAYEVYSNIRMNVTNNIPYDAPDIMIYLMAVSGLFQIAEFAKRALRVAMTANPMNLYYPKDVLGSMGLDYDNIRSNAMSFLSNINLRLAQMQGLALPMNIKAIHRLAYMYRDIYVDGSTVKDQLYMYVPRAFYKFGLDADGIGQLTYEQWTKTSQVTGTIANLMTIWDNMLQTVRQNQDFAIMSGHIMKAYGTAAIVPELMTEIAPLQPFANLGVLEQMKNTTVLGTDAQWNPSAVVTQNKATYEAFLISNPFISKSSDAVASEDKIAMSGLLGSRILTTTQAEPTPLINMENTRDMVIADSIDVVGSNIQIKFTCGTDFCLYADIIEHRPNGLLPQRSTFGYCGTSYVSELIRRSFKFAPAVLYVLSTILSESEPLAAQVNTVELSFDYDSITIVDKAELSNIHRVTLLSVFKVG